MGVGPGRYVLELEERKDVPRGVEVQPVHNVPLLVAAENGVPSAVVLGLALVLLGLHAWRRGPPARALYAAYLPFLFFDVLPYGNVQGLAVTGFWLGLLWWPAQATSAVDRETRDALASGTTS